MKGKKKSVCVFTTVDTAYSTLVLGKHSGATRYFSFSRLTETPTLFVLSTHTQNKDSPSADTTYSLRC